MERASSLDLNEQSRILSSIQIYQRSVALARSRDDKISVLKNLLVFLLSDKVRIYISDCQRLNDGLLAKGNGVFLSFIDRMRQQVPSNEYKDVLELLDQFERLIKPVQVYKSYPTILVK